MTLNRWDPVRDLLNFQERMNRLVHSRASRALVRKCSCWCPHMDMLETPDEYVLKVELPGVGKSNILIEVYGRRLRVSGDRNLESEPQCAAYHTVERNHGSFERSLDLPGDADLDKAEATYVDGLLEIHLPKTQEHRERVLTVVSLG
jgi:HSP20 family protein